MNIVPLMKAPSKSDAQKIIRQLISEGAVLFHPHARQRMKKRKISTLQILNCLETGHVDENPYQDLVHKGWTTAVVGNSAGVRLRIVICLQWSQKTLIVTCYFE